MATFLTRDEKYPDLTYDDDYRSYLNTRRDELGDYRFGRAQGKRIRVHARIALRHVNGYFKTMIAAIAKAKLRRMARELELRGIRCDRPNNDRVVRESQPTEHS